MIREKEAAYRKGMAERFAGVRVGTFRHLFPPYDPKISREYYALL